VDDDNFDFQRDMFSARKIWELRSRETELGGQGELLSLWITPGREEKAGSSLQEGTSLIKGFFKNIFK